MAYSDVVGSVLLQRQNQAACPCTVGLSATTAMEISLLGGKAVSLVRMMRLGLRVPPAFVLTTTFCEEFLDDLTVLDANWPEVRDRVRELEKATRKVFGGTPPLLVAVRSGAAVSLPGMMRTVLSVGAATSPQQA